MYRRIICSLLGRKTRSAFFTPILASAFFTRPLRALYVILRLFYLPTLRVFYSDPPPRFFFAAFFTRFFLFFFGAFFFFSRFASVVLLRKSLLTRHVLKTE